MTATPSTTLLDPAAARVARTHVHPARFLLETLPTPPARQPMLPLREAVAQHPAEQLRPEVDALARQLIAALVEVIAGLRPAPQLRAWVSGRVYELADEWARGGAAAGIRIQSIRLQAPTPRIIEASVHLRQAGRSRAAAVQLIFRDQRWQLTTLELPARRRSARQLSPSVLAG
jgi:hypothetical protein